MKNNSGKNILLYFLTPFIVLAVCLGTIILASLPFSDKLKVYKNLVFMDDLKTTTQTAGLNIIEHDDIPTDSKPQNDTYEEGEIIYPTFGEQYAVLSGEVRDTGDFIRPSFGEQFAVISCDALEFDVPVYWGSSRELFERGACQSSGSVLPGDEGNTVISAHEDTFFNDLYKLEKGDKITVRTKYGEFVYTVSELIKFKNTDNKYVSPSKKTKLTLYTCKKDVLGSADERIGVICELTEKKFYKEAAE